MFSLNRTEITGFALAKGTIAVKYTNAADKRAKRENGQGQK
jgi:hypothetical protein